MNRVRLSVGPIALVVVFLMAVNAPSAWTIAVAASVAVVFLTILDVALELYRRFAWRRLWSRL